MQESSGTSEIVDPCDIHAINERAAAWAGPGETVCPVGIERIVVADDGLDALADVVADYAAGGSVLMVVDRTPMRRGGDDLKSRVSNSLAKHVRLDVLRLPVATSEDTGADLHADMDVARELADELDDFAVVLAVGSGTVTDVVKYARHLHVNKTGRRLPFVSFPTAASVTAFTSALAALSVHGVKRTFPATPPDAVVCDLRTLADAPRAMTQAGFADVLARGVSAGDWFLAQQLGMDDGYSQVPARLLEGAEWAMIARAGGVAAGGLEAVRAVTEAMLLAGMAMSLVNKTAPLSGWEHVISHFLDMTAEHHGRPLALHGGQVGVAALLSARAYERAWGEMDLDRLTVDREERACRAAIGDALKTYDASGEMTAEVWRDYERKLQRWHGGAEARRLFVERCRSGEMTGQLRGIVSSAADINDALCRAGAPRRFEDLNAAIDPASARTAMLHGHLIRARFTFGDLLAESGWLTENHVEELLDTLRETGHHRASRDS